MIFKVVVDESTLTTDSNGKIKVKLSADENNGLPFDASGNLIATPGSSSGTGIYNNPGNGIAGVVNSETHKMDNVTVIGMNSTVSRHKKYSGADQSMINNDGPVLSKLSNTTITNDCIAWYMIPHNGGGD